MAGTDELTLGPMQMRTRIYAIPRTLLLPQCFHERIDVIIARIKMPVTI